MLLLYRRTDQHTFNVQFTPYDQEYIESHYRYVEE
jgi:hypothetical protein